MSSKLLILVISYNPPILLEKKQDIYLRNRYWLLKKIFYFETLIKEFLVDIPASVNCRDLLCSKVKTFPKLLCGLF